MRNLSREVNEEQLFQLFRPFGKIKSLNIVMDAATGRSKGFGFVDMPEDSEAVAAIKTLDGKLVQGLRMRVKRAVKQNYSPPGDHPDKVRPERFDAGKANRVIKGGIRHSSGLKKNRP